MLPSDSEEMMETHNPSCLREMVALDQSNHRLTNIIGIIEQNSCCFREPFFGCQLLCHDMVSQ